MQTRTLIYARVSTEDQVEKYGLPSQLRACREYAQAHKFGPITEEITDDGISGLILQRPGLDRVRALAKARAVEIVLTYDTDRLSRDLPRLLDLKTEIERSVRLEFVASSFEDSPSGRLFFSLRGAVAQFEREQTRERTMRGQRERAGEGKFVGGPVTYGYRYVPETGLLVIDEARAAVVREIYGWYLAGLSARAIVERLRQRGTPPCRNGRQWGHSTVRWILGNEAYTGTSWWGEYQRKENKMQPQPQDQWIALPVPPLIEQAAWSEVQQRIAERAQGCGGRPTLRFLLSGRLRCSCERPMHGEYHARRKYQSYRCAGRDPLDGAPCKLALPGRDTDAAVWSAIADAFGNPAFLRARLAEYRDTLAAPPPDATEHLRARMARLKRAEEAALRLLLDPDFAADRAQVKARYRAAQAERAAAEAEQARIEQARENAATAGDWLEEAATVLAEYIGGRSTVEARQEFLAGVQARVQRISAEELQIRCQIGRDLANTPLRSVGFPSLPVILTARLAA